jgi:hypothetical protein
LRYLAGLTLAPALVGAPDVPTLITASPWRMHVIDNDGRGSNGTKLGDINGAANAGNIKSLAVADLDQDGKSDLVAASEGAHGDRVGVYWLRQGRDVTAGAWAAKNISGGPTPSSIWCTWSTSTPTGI